MTSDLMSEGNYQVTPCYPDFEGKTFKCAIYLEDSKKLRCLTKNDLLF